VLAVVMTGMGADGAEGARCIRAAGGEVLVQDEATSVVWGMPGAVAATGQADQILPLAELGPAIVRRVAASHLLSSGQAAARL
jgi:two-component system chemotaxis response regulator CheB